MYKICKQVMAGIASAIVCFSTFSVTNPISFDSTDPLTAYAETAAESQNGTLIKNLIVNDASNGAVALDAVHHIISSADLGESFVIIFFFKLRSGRIEQLCSIVKT